MLDLGLTEDKLFGIMGPQVRPPGLRNKFRLMGIETIQQADGPELIPEVITVNLSGHQNVKLFIPRIDTTNPYREQDIKIIWESQPSPGEIFEALGSDWEPVSYQRELAKSFSRRPEARIASLKHRVHNLAWKWNASLVEGRPELRAHLQSLVDKELKAARLRSRQNSTRFLGFLASELLLAVALAKEGGVLSKMAAQKGVPSKAHTNRTWLALPLVERAISQLVVLHRENKALKAKLGL